MSNQFIALNSRRELNSLKYNIYSKDILPLWVADMDFPAPICVQSALKKHIKTGELGYALEPDSLYQALIQYYQEDFNWEIKKEWILWLPGTMSGIHHFIHTFCKNSSDEIIVFSPIYPPLLGAPEKVDRKLINMPLVQQDQDWSIDFEELDRKCSFHTKLLILCNPHNPVAKVFSKDELTQLERFCKERNIFILSDEIHCDLILNQELHHIPFPSLSLWSEENSLLFSAPSKSFNIPGLGCAYAIIPNPQIRDQLKNLTHSLMPELNVLAMVGTEAAYKDGKEWRIELKDVLNKNKELLIKELKNIPQIKLASKLDATYLAWLDVRELNLNNPYLYFLKHGVALSNGEIFGLEGFVRLNFACSEEVLLKGLKLIKKAIAAMS